jgi:hypothetical protein
MVLFGVTFFFATLWQSLHKGVFLGAWKSSAVAPIWAAGLGKGGGRPWKSDIESEAESMRMRIVEEQGAWLLRVEEGIVANGGGKA